jgi:hypothetical protein
LQGAAMTFLETLRRQDRVVLWLAWIVDPDWILIDGPGGFFWRVDQLSGRMTAAVRPCVGQRALGCAVRLQRRS